MIGYLDSSVLLRVLLNHNGKLREFTKLDRSISSKLLKAECLRSLDRSKVLGFLREQEYVEAVTQLYVALDTVELMDISDRVLERTGSGFTIPLGTLDAIHLSSAVWWREHTGLSPVFLTHDEVLAQAAITLGFRVLGSR